MQAPTLNQVYTGLRYASGYVATGGAIIVTAGALPPDTAHAIVDSAQKVIGDLKQLIGDSYLLCVLVGPIIMGIIAKLGWNSARPDNQKQALIAAQPNTVIAEASSAAAATKVATEMAAIQEVSKVVTTPSIANATPSDKIVAK